MKKNNFFKRVAQQQNLAHVEEYVMSEKQSQKVFERGEKIVKKMMKAMTFGTPGTGDPVADVASGMFAIAFVKKLYEEQAKEVGIDLDGIYRETELICDAIEA